jgi:hypothetical protein
VEHAVVATVCGPTNNNSKALPVSPLAQRFGEAVQTLVGEGPVKVRLAAAFSKYLGDLGEAEFPAGLRREFVDLHAAMTRVAPVGTETRIRASVQKMSPEQATAHASTIVKLYVELMNGVERAEPLKVVTPPKKPPRFLTGLP